MSSTKNGQRPALSGIVSFVASTRKLQRNAAWLLGAACVVLLAVNAAQAGTETVLHAFHGFAAGDGAYPESAPIMDSKGDLYGTASSGGSPNCGIVYKLHKSRSGSWKETIVYSFQCGDDGYAPEGGVILDKAGNLYGGTDLGGTGDCYFYGERIGCGAVYELSPGRNGTWTETVLYSWPAPSFDFAGPVASPTLGANGTLYGTTLSDNPCAQNWGSVFALKRVKGAWKEHDIKDFCGRGNDGRFPGYGALIFDPSGNLYGTTIGGGHGDDYGVVFKMSPVGHGQWQFTKIHQFTKVEGGDLQGGLTFDQSGNLYGAEFYGPNGDGAVFELSPKKDGRWKESILAEFGGTGPWQNPVFDSSGNLFGTTQGGGETQYCVNCGVIYELVPQGGGTWSNSVVYSFGSQPADADGSDPVAGLIRAPDGNFYGTTYEGGDTSCSGAGACGVVYEFTP